MLELAIVCAAWLPQAINPSTGMVLRQHVYTQLHPEMPWIATVDFAGVGERSWAMYPRLETMVEWHKCCR